jgi:CheY-like chemotaxis protein
MSLAQAVAALEAAGFALGTVREEPVARVAPGTVVGPSAAREAVLTTKIDLVVSREFIAPQTQLVFTVAGSKSLALKKRTTIAARVKVSKPARLTATLSSAGKQKLFTWKVRHLKAGANVVKLTLPKQIRRPGTYTVTWIARAGKETVSRTVKLKLVGKNVAQIKKSRSEVEVVLAGEQHPKTVVQSALAGTRARVVAQADQDQTFALAASGARDVKIVVVDVDKHGVGFVSDLRTVFPSIRVIAIATQPADRVRALRAGAVKALPRNTTSRQLAKAIAAISSR